MDPEYEWADEAVSRLIDGLADPVVCYLPSGLVLYSNSVHDQMYDCERGGLVGTDLVDLFPPEHQLEVRKALIRMATTLTPGNRTLTVTTELRPRGQRALVEWTNTAQFDDDGALVGILAVGRDMTRSTLQAARDAHDARHDPLTGVLNRHGIEHYLTQRWAEGGDPAPDLTVVFLDLDGFKGVNDRHGHAAGDATLIAVGDVLAETIRPDDLVGRHGGDEFVLILNGTRRADLSRHRIPQITASLETLAHPVGVSWGVAVPAQGEHWADAIRRADEAMRRHKAARRTERVGACAS